MLLRNKMGSKLLLRLMFLCLLFSSLTRSIFYLATDKTGPNAPTHFVAGLVDGMTGAFLGAGLALFALLVWTKKKENGAGTMCH